VNRPTGPYDSTVRKLRKITEKPRQGFSSYRALEKFPFDISQLILQRAFEAKRGTIVLTHLQ
jgi:hypothetical protein